VYLNALERKYHLDEYVSILAGCSIHYSLLREVKTIVMVYLCSNLDEMSSGIMWVFDRLTDLVECLFYFNLNARTTVFLSTAQHQTTAWNLPVTL